jgi:lysine 2,3-aminomutase
VNWKDPYNDAVFAQFIPLRSKMLPDHPMCKDDHLGEASDQVTKGLTHRYPDRVLFGGDE